MSAQPITSELHAPYIAALEDVARRAAAKNRDEIAELRREVAELRARPAERGLPGKDGESVSVEALTAIVERTVGRVVAALPAPAAGRDGIDGKGISVEETLALIRREVSAEVAKIPRPIDGKDGKNGADGTSVTAEDVRPTIEREVRAAAARIPAPVDGKDGRNGTDGQHGTSVTLADVAPLVERVVRGEVAKIPAPKDGRDGVDGSSVTLADVLPLVERAARTEVSKLPIPKDGRDGRNGEDGADGRDATEVQVLDTIVEGRPYPRGTWAAFNGGLWRNTGAEWINVVDGVNTVETKLVGERTLVTTVVLASGKKVETLAEVPVMIYRDTWREGEYRPGDCVTWAGSMWLAKRITKPTDRPGECDAWRLCVKQGRPGKSAP